MSNVKISALPAVTTVVPGTDVLPLVSGGITTKATPSAITTASLLANTGVLNIGSGQVYKDASGNVGIGIAPSTASGYTTLDLSNATNGARIRCLVGSTAYGGMYTNGTTDFRIGSLAAVPLNIITGSNTIATFDTAGNLGLGVVPSSWSTFKAFQVGATTALANLTTTTNLYHNSYYDGVSEKYLISSMPALRYAMNQGGIGNHAWFNAASGTAGNTISFTQAMTLDASGNLTISGATATKASGTTWANPSDTRLKDNQQLYTKGLDELLQIVVKTWEFNGKGGSAKGTKGLGVIADEIEIVLPEAVDTYSAKLNDEDDDETEIKRFDASEIIWLLVNSVKELSAQNNALEARLEALEGAK